MRRLTLPALLLAAIIGSACGTTSPTAPASNGSSSAFAVISGSVQAGVVSALTSDATGPMTGVTVSIPGTALSSGVDAAGRFTLRDVPPGSAQLRITGSGVDASVSLSPVQASQTVTLSVVVSGSTASIDTEIRSGAGEDELEGRVESLPPTMPALTFKAAGRTVKTTSSTQFTQGGATKAFGDLQIGMRVHARGQMSGDTLNATSVQIQNTNASIPVEVNGVIDSLAGTAASFQFNIGSRVIKGDANTAFFGDGDKPDTFADLHNDARVEVKGEQRDGFVYAVRIHVNGGNDGDDNQDDSASIHGTLKSIGGAIPGLTLMVDTTTVHTFASTTVKRRGDVQTLAELKVGQSLHVVGTRKSDGSIDARLIEIDDDAPGGAFEIEGSLGGLHGTCPALTFNVNGFPIATSAATTFEGGACASLKSGDTVKVNGTRNADGSVAATKVMKE
jgi:hypothetical protein